MVPPIVVPRDQHTLSRSQIDPDALKVLYRLRNADYAAYLVGGSVRDLLLDRRPKDFDVGTDAHPGQIKKLFRNCWIIGRRFRLAHVRFGTKVIEVATFRKQVIDAGSASADGFEPAPDQLAVGLDDPGDAGLSERDRLVRRDNSFGTPEEDAFRRDFTINALFYDIATFSIIDYVGGLEDLRKKVIRSIGEPDLRFLEDPVRMLRAIIFSARLGFAIDPPVYEAIARHKREIAKAAPARLLEEYYKILRSGHAADAFRALGEVGLLHEISPEVPYPLPPDLVRALDALDEYRRRFAQTPDTLTNAVLMGTLLVPLGLLHRRPRRRPVATADEVVRASLPTLGALPLARRDVERLQHVMPMQHRLRDVEASPRSQQSLLGRLVFRDALTWLTVHGDAPDLVTYWEQRQADVPARERRGEAPADTGEPEEEEFGRPRRRRRRRGRRPPR